jgi:hypothetical protein
MLSVIGKNSIFPIVTTLTTLTITPVPGIIPNGSLGTNVLIVSVIAPLPTVPIVPIMLVVTLVWIIAMAPMSAAVMVAAAEPIVAVTTITSLEYRL